MLVAVALLCASTQGEEQAGPARTAPVLDTRRFPEDYRGIAGTSAGRAWWARFKDRPLDPGGLWRLSFGLELRGQNETFRGDGLRTEPDESLDYVWWRALPTLELRRGDWRGFAQLIFAVASGLDEEPSPIDVNRADLLQGFIEGRVVVAGHPITVRAGRQLLAFGSQRLVGYRYGPNVPLAFDGALAEAKVGDSLRATLLWARPVASGPGAFDDEARMDESLFGLYTTTEVRGHGLDVYYLGHEDDRGDYDQGSAREERHTFGLRWFSDRAAFDWNAECFGQLGTFGERDIRAWSATVESGVRLEKVHARPRLFGRLSIISGDDDPLDDELGTFNPLYPRGKYFGEIGTIGPSNLIDVLLGVQAEPAEGWSVDASATAYWRESTADGIYANNGQLLRAGSASDARYVGYQGDLALTRQLSRTTSWTLGYSAFVAGDFIEDSGPSETLHFFQVSARLLF